jgi:hypothetical protein
MRGIQQSRISGLDLCAPRGFVKRRRIERTGRAKGQQGNQKQKIDERWSPTNKSP